MLLLFSCFIRQPQERRKKCTLDHGVSSTQSKVLFLEARATIRIFLHQVGKKRMGRVPQKKNGYCFLIVQA